jgi:acyl dehydratase
MPRWYFEDLAPGHVVEAQGPTVTAEAIVDFAKKFDPQSFHVDAEAAKRSPFGALIASGWHTTALCMRMVCDAYLLDAASLGSPGVDEVRWVKPVFAGDRLRLKMIVKESRPSRSRPDQGSILSHWEVYNQKDELVMHMTGWGMFKKRGS